MIPSRTLVCLFLAALPSVQAAAPVCTDERLVVELVAHEPDLVTPTGLTVDERGRIWVIENHTHQRQANYKGPKSDRIRILDDFDAHGRARRFRTFADGFRNAMSLAITRDGSVLLATRSTLYRLRDRDGDGVADDRQVLVKLDTPGDYPHNGLSGFAFDGRGNLIFGLGENLGAAYRLIGSDGTTLTGGGEGGNVYRCRPDGSKLVRLATGFWNPFHQGYDAFGRLFIVDNDPDSRGPCRLAHVIAGGDYGYRFRNGRKGLHPFTAWDGELPGTLPMVAGTAEAPCSVVPYESSGLPADYRGALLVTSWGDHIVERFDLTPRGASFGARGHVLLRGDDSFRPVALTVAPDGSLLISDWVDRSYPVHGKGRIWRVRSKKPVKDDGLRPSRVAALETTRLRALLSDPRRAIRAAAGEALVGKGRAGRDVLAAVLREEKDVRARMQALWSASQLETDAASALLTSALTDTAPEVRGEAAHLLGELLPADVARRDEKRLLELATKDRSAYVRRLALAGLRTPASLRVILPLLADADPFLAGTALDVLGRAGGSALLLPHVKTRNPALRLGVLLALRRSGDAAGRDRLPGFLADGDPGVRRAAVQWVGEERLHRHAATMEAAAARTPVTRDLLEAYLASNRLLSGGKPGDETRGEEYVARLVQDRSRPAHLRAVALRMLRPDHPALKINLLQSFLDSADSDLRREAARTLALRADEPSQDALRRLAVDAKQEQSLRSLAVVGLGQSAATTPASRRVLLKLLDEPTLRRESLRSLRAAAAQRETAEALASWWQKLAKKADLPAEERRELAGQLLLALPASKGRKELAEAAGPRPSDAAGWKAVLAAGGDAAAGERVFFHAAGPRCYSCHRVDGRGGAVGPDLSTIGRARSREGLLDAILTPSKEIAPQFMVWQLVTTRGTTHIGVIVEEGPHSTVTLADSQGKLIAIKRTDIEERRPLTTSLMPDNLPLLMTPREMRDLLAFLQARK